MEPSEGAHPDPIGQASAAAGQKVAEFAAVAAMLLQVSTMARARQAAVAADSLTQQNTELATARARWAPALDRGWLADATLRDVARVWGAAAPWEGTGQGAEAALEASETRLRELHPYAMRRYDDLRARGWGRTHAMSDAAPAFALHPSPRPAPEDANQGRYLTASSPGQDPDTAAASAGGADAAVTYRIMGILARLNEQEIAAGRGPLSPGAADVALRTRVSAPDSVIGAIVDGLRDGTLTVPAVTAPPPRRSVSSAGPAGLDWPADVRQAVAAGAGARTRPARRVPAQGQQPRLHP
jgi:hypothetical protein